MTAPIEFERVSFDDARKALESKIKVDEARGWRGERAPQLPEPLLETTAHWMDTLPASLRPVALAREFPRIANRLSESWKRPARCDEYFESLLIDHRGGRKGFPSAVAMELSTLASHYASLYPYRRSIWDDVVRR
jgi:hypothetical protein